MWKQSVSELVEEEMALLRDRARRQRRAGASTRAIRRIEDQIRALPNSDARQQGMLVSRLRERLNRLAVRLNYSQISHRGVPWHIRCGTHPDRDAVGRRHAGFHHVIFYCARCFAKAQAEDDAEP